jgi:hypothetical protein
MRHWLTLGAVFGVSIAIAGCSGAPTSTTTTTPSTTTTTTTTTAPSTTTSTTNTTTSLPLLRYGISSDFLAEAATPAGQAFSHRYLADAGLVRIFVPYDARGGWNGSTCADSPAYTAGAVAWNQLIDQLNVAKTDGLSAEIVFSSGTGIGEPSQPNPADPGQAADYRCGLQFVWQGLLAGAQAPGATIAMPVEYEAWNEPDLSGYGQGLATACPQPITTASCSGPWQAAMLWYIAQASATTFAQTGGPTLAIAALTESAPENPFFDDNSTQLDAAGQPVNGYYQDLYRIISCQSGYGGCQLVNGPTTMPAIWAIHDYADPSAGGTADLASWVNALAQLNNRYAAGMGATIWITESAVHLDSSFTSDDNHPNGVSCPASVPVAANTFGCLLIDHPRAQARGASAWLDLAQVTAPTKAGAIEVSQLFWYQFAVPSVICTSAAPCLLGNGKVLTDNQRLPVLHSWDSALVDSNGQGRASLCRLLDRPESDCQGQADPYADAHWLDWWQAAQMPEPCPAHDGAWIADRNDSGVPGNEECYYSLNTPSNHQANYAADS